MIIDLNKFTAPTLEEAVIAYLIQNNSVDTITSECTKEFFFSPFYQNIFTLCYDIIVGSGRGMVDVNALIENLRQIGKDSEENRAYIQELRVVELAKFPMLNYCIKQLKEFSRRRKFILITNKYLEDALKPDVPIDKTMSDNEQELLDIERGDGQKLELLTGPQIIIRRQEGLARRFERRMVHFNWPNMDARIASLSPGKLSLTAGRTSMGKSLFKTNLITNLCSNGTGVLNICPEQGFDSEHDRLDAINTSISIRDMALINKWDESQDHERLALLRASSETISKWEYCCIPSRNITVAGVQSGIRRFKRLGRKIDVVCIDLFDRLVDVNVARDRTANFSMKLAQISRIAEEEDVHMHLLVQINRGTEGRKDKRPTLGDLRDCGNFEQDSDLILLLYREGYYDTAVEDNILEVNIAKQRDGVSGVTPQFMIIDKNTLQIVPCGERAIPKKEEEHK